MVSRCYRSVFAGGDFTYSEKFTQRRVVRLAWLALDVFLSGGSACLPWRATAVTMYQVLGEPKSQHLQHPAQLIFRLSNTVALGSAYE